MKYVNWRIELFRIIYLSEICLEKNVSMGGKSHNVRIVAAVLCVNMVDRNLRVEIVMVHKYVNTIKW
jgi:hypothetical protein